MKTLAERIAEAKGRRDEVLKSMQAMSDMSETEGRTFNEEENKTFDKLADEAKALNGQIDRLETTEKLLAMAAVPVPTADQLATGPGPVAAPRAAIQMRDPKIEKGIAFARYAMALAAGHGNLMQSVEIARRWRDSTPAVETVLKAAVLAGSTTDSTFASALVYNQNLVSEFIELLRPATIIGRIQGLRRVPFNIRIPRQTTSVSVGWTGEGLSKGVSRPGFDAVTMAWFKTSVIVALTEELARFSDPSAEMLVRNDIIQAMATFQDQQFIDPAVAAVASVKPASITNGVTPINSTGNTVANITADLAAALGAMRGTNMPMQSLYWVLHPRTLTYLQLLRGTMDTFVFGDEISRGTLLGVPYIASTSVPVGAGPTFYSIIVLLAASEIFLADDGGVTLDTSREASIQLDSAPATPPTPLVSLWQQNLVGIRAEQFINWQRRRLQAVQVVQNVDY